MNDQNSNELRRPNVVLPVLLSIVALWLSQPPLRFWCFGFAALVPLIYLISLKQHFRRRDYLVIWGAYTLYWLASLQGLRHAHPLMHGPWLALGGYLAVYTTLFVAFSRFLFHRGISLLLVVPLAWVAQEYVRNYLLTGISVLMLGHVLLEVPILVQIADLFGGYGVSALLALTNLFIWQTIQVCRRKTSCAHYGLIFTTTLSSLLAVLLYGNYRLNQPLGDPLARFALIQRNEEVEYVLNPERQDEMFRGYAASSVNAARLTPEVIDAYIWPESMYSATNPHAYLLPDATVPPQFPGNPQDFEDAIEDQQSVFTERAGFLQSMLRSEQPASTQAPELIVGCGVIEYGAAVNVYSAVINIDSNHQVETWYGKTHLVMFGEYIPILPSIPGLKNLVPPGMGLKQGNGGQLMRVGDTWVAPNVCIETAVERVTLNQMREFHARGQTPDVIATVTNDGWFDDTSVIDHHLRCAQMVAIACRRPILSAANNGPTAWIDSRGQIVERLEAGEDGFVIATPKQDNRISLIVRIGDWPAAATVIICIALGLCVRKRNAGGLAIPSTSAAERTPPQDSVVETT
ncbi:MAG: apolipoprotein N-acyltransferase [Rubripirellula sp.]